MSFKVFFDFFGFFLSFSNQLNQFKTFFKLFQALNWRFRGPGSKILAMKNIFRTDIFFMETLKKKARWFQFEGLDVKVECLKLAAGRKSPDLFNTLTFKHNFVISNLCTFVLQMKQNF